MRSAVILGLFLLCTSLVRADVYTWIDAEGNRVFSDGAHPPHATRVQITPRTTQMSQPAPAPLAPKPEPLEKQTPRYKVLRILFPEPDSHVQDNNAGNLIVTASSEPKLYSGHLYRLQLDGAVYGDASVSPVFNVENLTRGTHQLAVEIVDARGRIIERTPTQPVHVQRMTLDQKRRTKPCQKGDWGVRLECPLKDKPKEEKPSLLPSWLPSLLPSIGSDPEPAPYSADYAPK